MIHKSIQSKGGGKIADAGKAVLNFILAIIITFILALIFMIILAFIVKLTGELIYGQAFKDLGAEMAGFVLLGASILAGAAVIGGKSDITIIN